MHNSISNSFHKRSQIMDCNIFKGVDLQTLVKRIGKSDIGVEILGIIIYTVAFSAQSEDLVQALKESKFVWNITECTSFPITELGDKNATSCSVLSDITGMSSSLIGIFVHLSQLIIAFKLINGAETRNDRQCHKWMVFTVLLTFLEGVTNAGLLTVDAKDNKLVLIYSVPSILYKLGSCGVVKSYVKEVKMMRNLMTNRVNITVEDLEYPQSDQSPLIS